MMMKTGVYFEFSNSIRVLHGTDICGGLL